MGGRRIVDVMTDHQNFTKLEKGQKALSCKSVRQHVEHECCQSFIAHLFKLMLLRDVPKDILRPRFLYNCPDRAERTFCDKIDNILSSNVFQWPWGTSEKNANYTPPFTLVFSSD